MNETQWKPNTRVLWFHRSVGPEAHSLNLTGFNKFHIELAPSQLLFNQDYANLWASLLKRLFCHTLLPASLPEREGERERAEIQHGQLHKNIDTFAAFNFKLIIEHQSNANALHRCRFTEFNSCIQMEFRFISMDSFNALGHFKLNGEKTRDNIAMHGKMEHVPKVGRNWWMHWNSWNGP